MGLRRELGPLSAGAPGGMAERGAGDLGLPIAFLAQRL